MSSEVVESESSCLVKVYGCFCEMHVVEKGQMDKSETHPDIQRTSGFGERGTMDRTPWRFRKADVAPSLPIRGNVLWEAGQHNPDASP